jgi:hypothetical protein
MEISFSNTFEKNDWSISLLPVIVIEHTKYLQEKYTEIVIGWLFWYIEITIKTNYKAL